MNDESCASVQEKARRLYDEIYYLTAVHELNKYFSYSKEMVQRVNKSFASNGFITIQFELMRAELLGVCRLWDSSGNDFCSLPAIAKSLRRAINCKLEWLSEIKQNAVGPIKKMEKPEWENKVFQACARVDEVTADDRLLKLFNFRDKYIAHSLKQTRRERRMGVSSLARPKNGDEEYFFKVAQDLAAELYSLVIDGRVNFSTTDEFRMREAKLFNESVVFLTKKEYNELQMKKYR